MISGSLEIRTKKKGLRTKGPRTKGLRTKRLRTKRLRTKGLKGLRTNLKTDKKNWQTNKKNWERTQNGERQMHFPLYSLPCDKVTAIKYFVTSTIMRYVLY